VGKRLVPIKSESINLPPLSELDGLVFAFITRRHTIMPFAQRLSLEQAALAYLWGESTHSYASEPAKAGESVRTVGTDPFIVGSRGFKVNRFYEILKGLDSKFPGKLMFFQYNTGGVGEILERTEVGGQVKKNLVRKAVRVPIDLMAALQRGDLRGTNKYKPCIFGTEEVIESEGDLTPFDSRKFYSQDQIDFYLTDIVNGRRKFTEEVGAEGLNPDILKAAEKSFAISPKEKPKFVSPGMDVGASTSSASGDKAKVNTAPPRSIFSDLPPVTRPPRRF
jgi:phosphoenolpyruvate carboxykinase (ATP)